MGDGFQVARVSAVATPTSVVNFQTGRDRTKYHLVDGNMDINSTRMTDRDICVTVVRKSSTDDPAIILDGDPFRYAYGKRARLGAGPHGFTSGLNLT